MLTDPYEDWQVRGLPGSANEGKHGEEVCCQAWLVRQREKRRALFGRRNGDVGGGTGALCAGREVPRTGTSWSSEGASKVHDDELDELEERRHQEDV